MSTVNLALFEEGTEIVVDDEVEAPDAGWTLDYVSVVRIGALVALHIEANNAAGAAAPVLKLQPDFAPGDIVTTPDGKFTLGSDGALSFTGSTAAAGRAVAQLVYAARSVSP